MPSPLLGMNPFLEQPELWSEFHSRMIVAIADALSETLSDDYRIAVEKRVYLSQGEDSILIGIPDVAITAPPTLSSSSTATLTQPKTIEVPLLEEVQERYLEIREISTGQVITVIELLSPKNKRSGEGRNAYLHKRQQILMSQTHFVEIDLLRSGEPLPMIGAERSDYRILISPAPTRPKAQLYSFPLRQPIPTIAIPLVNSSHIPLDLQPLLHQTYDRARFHKAIDYDQQVLKPKLSPEDTHWLTALLSPNSSQND